MSTTEKQPVWADQPRPTLRRGWDADGNAFALLAHAQRAQRDAGWSQSFQAAWYDEATSDDYGHLLRTILAWHDLPGDEED